MKLPNWDPEIDTPATIAILGGGPIGVEAALYARFLGYFVMLFDRVKVGDSLMRWAEYPMPAAWSEITSPLGLAALEAQGSSVDRPPSDSRVSRREYAEKYLLPVARTDLLYDFVNINSPVVSISRTGCTPSLPSSFQRRAEQEFRVLVDSQQRGQYSQLVDIILDCSGMAVGQGLASGGGWAVNEKSLSHEIRDGKVDVLGRRRADYAGKHTLLVGNDAAACGNVLDFSELARQSPGTHVTWLTSKRIGGNKPAGKIRFELPSGAPEQWREQVQTICDEQDSGVVHLAGWGIEKVQKTSEQWLVNIQSTEEETLDIQCDQIINCSPTFRDMTFCHALAPLVDVSNSDSLERLITREPHYYVLGQKYVGSHRLCSIAEGLDQIRQVFALIGGRADLDLYETIRRQQT